MYKKILLATDGSEASKPVLEEGMKLAEESRAILRLVFVVDESYVYHGGPGYDYLSYIASCRKEGQSILDAAEQWIKSKSSIHIETSLLELKPFQGRIADVIIEAANDFKADLLMIGTHGRRGFSHIFMGSVAENVIRIATTPVLLVRGRTPA